MIQPNNRSCVNCGKTMLKPSTYSYSQWNRKNYCSNHCAAKLRKTGAIKKCIKCSKEFYYRPSMRIGNYCSKSCSQLGKRNAIGKHIVSEHGREKMKMAHFGKKISEKTRENMSIAQIKKWDKIGRKTYKRYIHTTSSKEYVKWRSDVFQRDNWTCQTCHIRGVYLETHHIKSWAKYPESRFNLGNGVTLCRECHKLTDNYKNKKNESR